MTKIEPGDPCPSCGSARVYCGCSYDDVVEGIEGSGEQATLLNEVKNLNSEIQKTNSYLYEMCRLIYSFIDEARPHVIRNANIKRPFNTASHSLTDGD